jgi:hypothetical protein
MSLNTFSIVSTPAFSTTISDSVSGGRLKLQSGNDCTVRVLVLDASYEVMDLTAYSSATLEFKALNADGTAPDEEDTIVVQKVDSSLTALPTKAQWAAGTSEHISIALSDIETNLTGTYWMSVYLTGSAGELHTVLADKIDFLEDGIQAGGSPTSVASPYLISANNLSDLADSNAAAANLGIPLAFSTVASMSAYDVSSLSNGAIARLDGYTSVGDGAEGTFYLDKANGSISADDGVIITAAGTDNYWRRMYVHEDGVHVDWFGAVGDGATDDYANIMKAVNNYQAIRFGYKTYYVATPIGFTNEQEFLGVGLSSTINRGSTIKGLTDCFTSTDASNRDNIWKNLNFTTSGATSVGINVAGNPTGGLSNMSLVEQCSFENDLQYGIKGTAQGLKVINSIFGEHSSSTNNMLAGAYLDDTQSNTAVSFIACKFRYAEKGLLLEETSGVNVSHCLFESLSGVAAHFKGCGPVTVDKSYFENCRTTDAGDDGFIRFDSSDTPTGCKGLRVSGNYFINNGSVNIDTIIGGSWVTALMFECNYIAMGGSGKYLFNSGAQEPYLSQNNQGIQASYTPVDFPDYNDPDMDALTSKGDLLVYDGSDYVRVPVGTNDDVLTADSAQSAGVKWAAGGGGGGDGTGWTLITTSTIGSTVATVSLDNTVFDGSYTNYRVVFEGISWQNDDGGISFQVSTDNGTSYLNTDEYSYTRGWGYTVTADASKTTKVFLCRNATNAGVDSTSTYSGELHIYNPHSTDADFKTMVSHASFLRADGTTIRQGAIGIGIETSASIDNIQFTGEFSNSFTAGTIKVYGA